MFLLWFFIILFVFVVLGKKQQQQQVCQDPVSTAPQAPTAPPAQTDPPRDPNGIYDPMNGSTIMMKVGEKRKVLLSGNATTGYAWRIVKTDGNSVEPDEKWNYILKSPFLTGSGGYSVREFEAVEPGLTDVYLIYDQVSQPVVMGYYYFLRFDVRW